MKTNINTTIIKNLSKPEARKFIIKNNLSIKHTEEIFKKITIPERGIDKNKIDTRIEFKYGGYYHGVITDSIFMILDKNISQNLYKKMWNKEHIQRMKNIDPKEKEKILKKWQKIDLTNAMKYKSEFPHYKEVIPKQDGIIAFIKNYSIYHNDLIGAIITNGKIKLEVDANRLSFMLKNLPGAEIRIIDINSPVLFFIDNELKGLLMPLRQ